MLPKKSAICKQFRKCGKAGCKCNAGALHGPYFFFFYRVDGKLKKSYIRKADVFELWKGYSYWREVRRKRAADRRKYTQMRRELREIDRLQSKLSVYFETGEWK